MAQEFPKKEHYSNFKMMFDKSLLKRLLRIEELKRELFGAIFRLILRETNFRVIVDSNGDFNFKDSKIKFNSNIKSIFSSSYKKYPQNVFKKESKFGLCEVCNNKKALEKVHIIKKSVLRKPYSEWFFLKFHPINIIFLCRDCHNWFESRHNGELPTLSASKMNRIKKNLNDRIRRIKIAMKSDEKYLHTYKKKIDLFNTQKKKMLSRLLEDLCTVH